MITYFTGEVTVPYTKPFIVKNKLVRLLEYYVTYLDHVTYFELHSLVTYLDHVTYIELNSLVTYLDHVAYFE